MLKAFWPSSVGSILLTTRRAAVAQAARGGPETKLKVKVLSVEESHTLFLKKMAWENTKAVDESESDAVKHLLEELRGLPLGICQITSLIQLKQLTVKGFLRCYV